MLGKWIPKDIRTMIVTTRKFDPVVDDIHDMLLQDFQYEALLQEEFGNDKIRALQNIAQKIHNKESFIKQSKGEAKKMLAEQLEDLEQEQFELLRNEILNACKDSAGLLDMKKLRKVKGSSKCIAKIENKPKT